MGKLPDGISPTGHTNTTIKHFRCERCGCPNQILLAGFVPAHYYNAVTDFCRKAAGDQFVLLPVTTLNAMGEEREQLAQRVRELERHSPKPPT